MKVYLAGPMRGYPEFNFPLFHRTTKKLRKAGHTVFNPAERDESVYGKDFTKSNKTGDEAQAVTSYSFNLREALAADMKFICEEAEAIALLPGWEHSAGALAEFATAKALSLKFIYL